MTPPPEVTADSIRTIIQKEVPALVRKELASVEERLTERIVGVETRLDGVEGRLKGISKDLADFREQMIGLIDERFPPVGSKSKRRSGGRSAPMKVAAKGR